MENLRKKFYSLITLLEENGQEHSIFLINNLNLSNGL